MSSKKNWELILVDTVLVDCNFSSGRKISGVIYRKVNQIVGFPILFSGLVVNLNFGSLLCSHGEFLAFPNVLIPNGGGIAVILR